MCYDALHYAHRSVAEPTKEMLVLEVWYVHECALSHNGALATYCIVSGSRWQAFIWQKCMALIWYWQTSNLAIRIICYVWICVKLNWLFLFYQMRQIANYM